MEYVVTQELEALESTLRSFLKRKERVLLCFPENGSSDGEVLSQMVIRCGGVPVLWGNDFRWKELLKRGFQNRCGVVIGAPGIVLGLSKLAKRMGTPLYIRNVILVGEEPDTWLAETIQKALDCCIRACCIRQEPSRDETVETLRRELRRWTTILDFRLEKMGPGLSLEMVIFRGEKLPRLPSFARLVVREWNPDRDCPFDVPLQWKNQVFSLENH